MASLLQNHRLFCRRFALSDTSSKLEVFPASQGAGPLLQRDYWAVLTGSACSPEEIVAMLALRFPDFANPVIAAFSFVPPPPLEVGREMKIVIQGYGECHVRVAHKDERSITLRTLEDHFEAGRITFGAWRENGETVFKVRSRARTRSKPHSWGFAAGGHRVQKQLWLEFVKNVAKNCGVEDAEVQEETEEVASTLADLGELDTPTFLPQ
jgi:hypothetical protein